MLEDFDDEIYVTNPNDLYAEPCNVRKKGSSEHRASCHRCGNMRRHVLSCTECPYIFCRKCQTKMKEEHGDRVFIDGCPVCKDLCCCGSNKSVDCRRTHHCYKKCPRSKIIGTSTSNPFTNEETYLFGGARNSSTEDIFSIPNNAGRRAVSEVAKVHRRESSRLRKVSPQASSSYRDLQAPSRRVATEATTAALPLGLGSTPSHSSSPTDDTDRGSIEASTDSAAAKRKKTSPTCSREVQTDWTGASAEVAALGVGGNFFSGHGCPLQSNYGGVFTLSTGPFLMQPTLAGGVALANLPQQRMSPGLEYGHGGKLFLLGAKTEQEERELQVPSHHVATDATASVDRHIQAHTACAHQLQEEEDEEAQYQLALAHFGDDDHEMLPSSYTSSHSAFRSSQGTLPPLGGDAPVPSLSLPLSTPELTVTQHVLSSANQPRPPDTQTTGMSSRLDDMPYLTLEPCRAARAQLSGAEGDGDYDQLVNIDGESPLSDLSVSVMRAVSSGVGAGTHSETAALKATTHTTLVLCPSSLETADQHKSCSDSGSIANESYSQHQQFFHQPGHPRGGSVSMSWGDSLDFMARTKTPTTLLSNSNVDFMALSTLADLASRRNNNQHDVQPKPLGVQSFEWQQQQQAFGSPHLSVQAAPPYPNSHGQMTGQTGISDITSPDLDNVDQSQQSVRGFSLSPSSPRMIEEEVHTHTNGVDGYAEDERVKFVSSASLLPDVIRTAPAITQQLGAPRRVTATAATDLPSSTISPGCTDNAGTARAATMPLPWTLTSASPLPWSHSHLSIPLPLHLPSVPHPSSLAPRLSSSAHDETVVADHRCSGDRQVALAAASAGGALGGEVQESHHDIFTLKAVANNIPLDKDNA